MKKFIIKRSVIIVILLAVAVILLLAWAPWLTEEYGKEKVIDYFNWSYGVNMNDIKVGSVEKKTIWDRFGIISIPFK